MQVRSTLGGHAPALQDATIHLYTVFGKIPKSNCHGRCMGRSCVWLGFPAPAGSIDTPVLAPRHLWLPRKRGPLYSSSVFFLALTSLGRLSVTSCSHQTALLCLGHIFVKASDYTHKVY